VKRVLSSLLLVLLLLCGLTDRAEGAATPLQKTASGSFGENPNKRAYVDPLLVVELQRDFELWGYDLGLGVDVGPNLYAYVNQNPWTHFDPLGLRANGGKGLPAGKKRAHQRMRQEFKEYGGWKQVASTGSDFVPFAGAGKGAYETIKGTDPITGKQLSTGERVVAGIGTVASAIPGGKAAVKGVGKAIMKGGDEAATTVTASAREVSESTERTVSRWMSKDEFEELSETQKLTPDDSGGKYILNENASDTEIPGAVRPGSVKAEFEIPTDTPSVVTDAEKGWENLYTDKSVHGRLEKSRGNPAPTELPKTTKPRKVDEN